MVYILVPGLYVIDLLSIIFSKTFAHVLLLFEPHLLGHPMIVQSI